MHYNRPLRLSHKDEHGLIHGVHYNVSSVMIYDLHDSKVQKVIVYEQGRADGYMYDASRSNLDVIKRWQQNIEGSQS